MSGTLKGNFTPPLTREQIAAHLASAAPRPRDQHPDYRTPVVPAVDQIRGAA
jgi:hypothetical protein